MQWQPQEEPLRQLVGYLADSIGPNPDRRARAGEMLQQAKQSPDVCNYLCHILISPTAPQNIDTHLYPGARSAAGILLKNHLKGAWSGLTPDAQSYVKQSLIVGVGDTMPQIRSLTGSLIAEVVRNAGLLQWPEILSTLISLIDGYDNGKEVPMHTREGAMGCLAKICEDNRKSLDTNYNGERPLSFLIPKFLSYTSHESDKIRAYALGTINIFISSKPAAITDNIDNLLSALTRLASDPSDEVRKSVCRSLVQLVDVQPDKIRPSLPAIIDYMIGQQSNREDEELALEAAEFWLTLGEHDLLQKELGPYLPKIIPTLLASMVYSEDDIEELGGQGDDAEVEDKAEDLKPLFAKVKPRLNGGTSTEEEEQNKQVKMGDDDDLSEGEIEDDDFFETVNPEDKWNLRKCSAAALDVLASVYHDNIFQIILPYLEKNLQHTEWPYQEAAVLALGAVADGCWDTVTPHLPKLIPYLLTLLDSKEPLVRQITCWTLGRYSKWTISSNDPNFRRTYLERILVGLLGKMLDGNKKVQEAGASAFAFMEEQTQKELTPYLEPILRQFMVAFARYKDRNRYILYDCIQTLAEHVGEAIAKPPAVNILMPPLLERYQSIRDDNQELLPLLECLSFIAQAMGEYFHLYAQPIFYRCLHLIHNNLEQGVRYRENPELPEPNKDYLITSLDLLSAIIQALLSKSLELVASTRPSFLQILLICLQDVNNEVKQSAYALLGDCAIYVYSELKPIIPQIMGHLIEELDLTKLRDNDDPDTTYSVINNACWSCGEISLQKARHPQEAGMSSYVERLFTRLLAVVQTPAIPASLTENAAIALGRLGLACCEDLAPHLQDFAEPFLHTLNRVQETDEKDTAFCGLALITLSNPQAMESCLKTFFDAIAKYNNPSKQLHTLFQQVIDGYRGAITDWPGFIGGLSAQHQEKLRAKYSI
ncbi:Transportin-1 [Arthrobotrys entomopaga]|nr:Transportin-1 [Arthrobotrys entomopaga]